MRRTNIALILGALLGLITGFIDWWPSITAAQVISDLFIKLLQLISLPILFFAIVSTIAKLEHWQELATLGRRILRYTLLTTYISALIGLAFILTLSPSGQHLLGQTGGVEPIVPTTSYWHFLWQLIPDNAIGAFADNNVMGVAFIGLVLGLATLQLEPEHKETCTQIFSAIFAAILKLASYIIEIMPVGVWAFMTVLVHQSLVAPEQLHKLMYYAMAVVGANLVQGFIVIPALLKARGLSPVRTFKGTWPALMTAFFTKSSSAAMPVTFKSLTENLKVNEKTAHTAVPLCTIINMNGCAAFILITVLFVSMSHGMTFDWVEIVMWTFMATLAAVGNAGVPMGCYFLTSAFLMSMNVPLTLLGWILPLYMVFDMIETALNVWSDISITTIVDNELTSS